MTPSSKRIYKTPRKMSKKYCKKTPCKKMGFSQKASCRPYKNCYKNNRKSGNIKKKSIKSKIR